MRTLIFTEGGNQVGLGHISRCSSLYDELEARGIEVEFIINGDSNCIEFLKNRKVHFINWLSKEFLNNFINDNDLCIVDSYLVSEELCMIISNCTKKCLFIDDNGRINYPKGIVVNPSLSPNRDKYSISDGNCYLLGPKYIILRSPFIMGKRDDINQSAKEVLITIGGSDVHKITQILLKKLCSRYPAITFNVVLGSAFNNIEEIKKYSTKNINFYENATADEMKIIMLKSDFAITAAGQTIHELLATQTPFIPIKIADNQGDNIRGLKKFNLIEEVLQYNDSLFLEKLICEFEKMKEFTVRQKLSNQYKKVLDGFGSKRIIDVLIKENKLENQYFIRKVRKEDIHDIFQLSNEDYVRKYSINTRKISWDEHVVWFNNIFQSEEDVFFVVTDHTNKFLGQLRYKIEYDFAIVSISLSKSVLGKGLSHKFLNQSMKLISKQRNDLGRIEAFVSDNNVASKKLFEKSGFLLSENSDGLLKYVRTLNKGVRKNAY